MAEMEVFERRVRDALLAYADEMPTRVDASAVLERVAVERAATWWPRSGLLPRYAWALVMAILLLLLLVGSALLVGRWRIDTAPFVPLRPSGVQMLEGGSMRYDRVVVDGQGSYWAIGMGRLTRFDPGTGARTWWSVGDDAAFGGLIAGPAAAGGVWVWSPAEGCRRFDGTAFRESKLPAGDRPSATRTGWAQPPHPLLQVASDGAPWWATPVERWDGSDWASLPGQPPLDPGGSRQLALGPGAGEAWVADSYFGWGDAVISHFDGRAWSSASLTDAARAVIVVPADGPPRAATSDGRFLRFDGEAWRDEPGPGFGVWDLVADADGVIWAVSDDADSPALGRYDGGRWTMVVAGGGAGTATGTLSVTPAGLFLPTTLGLQRLVGSGWEPAWPDAAPEPRSLEVIEPASRDEVWAAAGELGHFENGRWDAVPIPAEVVPSGTVASWVGRGPDGTVWVSGSGGIAGLSGGEWRVVAPIGEAHSVGVAADGLLWASGVADGAIAVVSPEPAEPVRWISCSIGPSMVVGSDGYVYVSGDGGLGRVVGTGCEWLDVLGTGQAYESNGIIAGPEGRLLASIGETTQLFDGTRWMVVDGQPFGTGSNPIYVFDRDGDLWRLPYDPSGAILPLERFEGGEWIAIAEDHPWQRISAIRTGAPAWLVVTADGALWFGGQSGVGRIAPGE